MIRKTIFGVAISMGLALAACAPMRDFAQMKQSLSATGTVEAIDSENRRVVVRSGNRTILYRVSNEVRNLDQVQVGDVITLDYVESVAVAMADPEDSGEPLIDVYGMRAPEGARPGGAGTTIATAVVEFLGYDSRSHIAQFRTPDGEETSALVPRKLRHFAASRESGDKVLVLVEQAVAVSVTPGS